MADEHHWRVDQKYLVKTKKEALELVAKKVSGAALAGNNISFELLEIGPVMDAFHNVNLTFNRGEGKPLAHYELKSPPVWMERDKKGEFVKMGPPKPRKNWKKKK